MRNKKPKWMGWGKRRWVGRKLGRGNRKGWEKWGYRRGVGRRGGRGKSWKGRLKREQEWGGKRRGKGNRSETGNWGKSEHELCGRERGKMKGVERRRGNRSGVGGR